MSTARHLEAARRLRRARPRSRFLRLTGLAVLVLTAAAWIIGDFRWGSLLTPRRLANLERFLGEIRPYPLHGEAWDWGTAAAWAWQEWLEKGAEATKITLALSVVSIVLAGAFGLLLALPAARTWATPEPFVPGLRPPAAWRRLLWSALAAASRALLIFLRALPEYVWAFILLVLIGPTAWPIVLALAIHNTGILGKLDAEVIENLPQRPHSALRGVGGGRFEIAAVAVYPEVLPRFLLFFFYRWETCVREATVLGMLGIVSLGYWIIDARARQLYDEMVFFVLLGAMLVLIGDLVSAWVRGRVRTAR